jgi:hypothetical protein
MIELQCHICGAPHTVTRADMLRLPPATYRACPACRDAENSPVAPCVVTWSVRGRFWSAAVPRCPLCGGKHGHGAGDGEEPDLGHRNAHCVTDSGSYELVETPVSIEERARRRAKAVA